MRKRIFIAMKLICYISVGVSLGSIGLSNERFAFGLILIVLTQIVGAIVDPYKVKI